MADELAPESLSPVTRNISAVLVHIQQAAQRAGRQPDAIRLVAATKFVPLHRVQEAIEAGVRILGESRLQEALPKMHALRSAPELAWHFIGRLQRRKVKSVVGVFEMIHSVDSLTLAEEINRRAGESGVSQAVLLEVNIGGESTKAGFMPSDVADVLTALDGMPNLTVKGLMVIPPQTAQAEQARPYFRRTRGLAEELGRLELKQASMGELSMGMSQDYHVAVEEGATLVRVGTAIFGERPE
ncbi:MAG: YggS family pyridoxal phosphate-dependent enzyme [Nitrospiraceae bacterium]